MATGQRAFPGATPAAIYDAVLNRAPAAPGALRPDLPAELDALILRLLAKDPAQRCQTSGEVASELRRLLRRTLGASSPTLLVASASRSRLRAAWRRAGPRRLAAGTAAIAIAAIAILVLRERPRAAALSERDQILLAEFQNQTGDAVFDLTLREALAVQLSQSPFLAIVPEDRVRETLGMMTRPADERLTRPVAREACERLGAKAMLEGQIAALGRSYVLTLEATDCLSGESLAREQAQADSKERVLAALGGMASSMRSRLGESLATVSRFDVPIEQATTRSLDALKAYALGVAQRAKGDDIGAIPLLEHAVLLDPGFASAHSALSAIFGGLGETEERANHARLAFASREHVTERERLFIEYQHHDAIGDERRAIEILEMWKQLYPRDYRPPNALAVALNRLGRYQRAIEEAQEARAPQPAAPVPALEPRLRLSRREPLRRGPPHRRGVARATSRDAAAAAPAVPAGAARRRHGPRRADARVGQGPAARVRPDRRAGAGRRLRGPAGARAPALPGDRRAGAAPEPGSGRARLRGAGRVDRGALRQPPGGARAGARRAAARAE